MTLRQNTPAPLLRRGPRPLLLHLTLAMLRSSVSQVVSPLWNGDSRTSSAAAILQSIRDARQDGSDKNECSAAVLAETLRQDAALIGGIAAYRRHSYRRCLEDPPTIWTEGSSRLLAYGSQPGVPVLFIPSLINRAYILDLMQEKSMLRWLAGQGTQPFLLDWGWPEETERKFSLTDYVAGRMERAITAANQFVGKPPVLVGYCMGGTLAVAAAQRRPDLISGLALLAAPWDFHAPEPGRAVQAAQTLPFLEPAMAVSQALPVDVLQSLFALLDPWSVAAKYRAFARLPADGDRARLFVAMEDWLNDGMPLGAPVARTCLVEWYGENAPAQGTWRIAGLPVNPAAITAPAFVAVPGRDRIVPPASAQPLANLIPKAVMHQPAAGHVGMVAGFRAETALWRPLLSWLHDLHHAASPVRRRRP